MIAGTVIAVVYMFTNFVTAATFSEFQIVVYYDSYYALLERRNDARDAGNDAYAEELERQMERVKAKICEDDPEWERCKHDR